MRRKSFKCPVIRVPCQDRQHIPCRACILLFQSDLYEIQHSKLSLPFYTFFLCGLRL